MDTNNDTNCPDATSLREGVDCGSPLPLCGVLEIAVALESARGLIPFLHESWWHGLGPSFDSPVGAEEFMVKGEGCGQLARAVVGLVTTKPICPA